MKDIIGKNFPWNQKDMWKDWMFGVTGERNQGLQGFQLKLIEKNRDAIFWDEEQNSWNSLSSSILPVHLTFPKWSSCGP